MEGLSFSHHINALPSEVLAYIFSYFMHEEEGRWHNISRDIVICSRVCLHWRDIITNWLPWGSFSLLIKGGDLKIPPDVFGAFLNQPCLAEVPEIVIHEFDVPLLEGVPDWGGLHSSITWKRIFEKTDRDLQIRTIRSGSLKFLRFYVASKKDYFFFSHPTTIVLIRHPHKQPFRHTFEHIPKLTDRRIRVLNPEGCWLGVDTHPLEKLEHLQNLNLSKSELEITPELIYSFPKLRTLRLPKNFKVSQALWNALLDMSELKVLSFTPNFNLIVSETSPRLKTLQLHYGRGVPFESILEFLKPFLPKLKKLELHSKSTLTSENIVTIVRLGNKHLRIVNFSKEVGLNRNDVREISKAFPGRRLKTKLLNEHRS
eukprot:TRINITY_DN2718_c0_g1_i4.p1 TRINITY_DN2718_c0_g1~~TRINITY_DN2718_c0_g1_i4.p1  ORF type:complete len:372 (+),score=27.70 TRINITY_DN2718_c0_g1_i4:314-1429(+)